MEIKDIRGLCVVRFVGENLWTEIHVAHIWQNNYGKILYVEAMDGAIYNWSNIIAIRKVGK